MSVSHSVTPVLQLLTHRRQISVRDEQSRQNTTGDGRRGAAEPEAFGLQTRNVICSYRWGTQNIAYVHENSSLRTTNVATQVQYQYSEACMKFMSPKTQYSLRKLAQKSQRSSQDRTVCVKTPVRCLGCRIVTIGCEKLPVRSRKLCSEIS